MRGNFGHWNIIKSKHNFASPVPVYFSDSKLHKVLVSHTEDFSH